MYSSFCHFIYIFHHPQWTDVRDAHFCVFHPMNGKIQIYLPMIRMMKITLSYFWIGLPHTEYIWKKQTDQTIDQIKNSIPLFLWVKFRCPKDPGHQMAVDVFIDCNWADETAISTSWVDCDTFGRRIRRLGSGVRHAWRDNRWNETCY